MATITAQGNPNLAAIVNDSGSSGVFYVTDDSTPATLFEVHSTDGGVRLYGTVRRAGEIQLNNISTGASGSNAEFRTWSGAGPTTRFTFSTETTGGRISSGSAVVLEVEGDDFYLVKDTGTGVIAAVLDASGDTVFEQTDGPDLVGYASGVETARITARSGSSDDSKLALGSAGAVRGKLVMRRSADSGNERQGVLQLQDQAGQSYYIWADTSGNLRIDTSDPGSSDTAGAIIGP